MYVYNLEGFLPLRRGIDLNAGKRNPEAENSTTMTSELKKKVQSHTKLTKLKTIYSENDNRLIRKSSLEFNEF